MQKSLSRSDWEQTPSIVVVLAWSSLSSYRQHGRNLEGRARRTRSLSLPREDEAQAGRNNVSSAAVGNSSLASFSVIRWPPSLPRLASMAS